MEKLYPLHCIQGFKACLTAEPFIIAGDVKARSVAIGLCHYSPLPYCVWQLYSKSQLFWHWQSPCVFVIYIWIMKIFQIYWLQCINVNHSALCYWLQSSNKFVVGLKRQSKKITQMLIWLHFGHVLILVYQVWFVHVGWLTCRHVKTQRWTDEKSWSLFGVNAMCCTACFTSSVSTMFG